MKKVLTNTGLILIGLATLSLIALFVHWASKFTITYIIWGIGMIFFSWSVGYGVKESFQEWKIKRAVKKRLNNTEDERN